MDIGHHAQRDPEDASSARRVEPQPSDLPITVGDSYFTFLSELKSRIAAARLRAAVAVNRELVVYYWGIGRDILSRQESEGWGSRVIERLSDDLHQEFPQMTGLSARNLKYMRSFAEAYPDAEFVQQVVAQLPWGHNLRLLEALKTYEERAWYAQQALEHGWSRNVLNHQMSSRLMGLQGKALTNFDRTLPRDRSELAHQLLKDPYCFDFLDLGADVLERDLKRSIIEHLQALILELGKGFAFVGNQYHLKVGGQDYYLDLLFYHLRLRCYVVIELKIEEFKPEFAGKMNFYLSAVNDQLRHADDGPTIGIILCSARNEVIVEYALRDTSKPMGVTKYELSTVLPEQLKNDLPTLEELSYEFPIIWLVQLRIELERTLRILAAKMNLAPQRPGITPMLQELELHGMMLSDSDHFVAALKAMNQAAHGYDVDPQEAEEALKSGSQLLGELKALLHGGEH